MTVIRTIATIALATLSVEFAGAEASANVIQITHGAEYSSSYDNGGMGSGRGVSFLANSNFSISSVGFDLNVTTAGATNYVYQIFGSANGQTPGSLLASHAFTLASGSGYRDEAFSYSFNAGSHYIVNFARLDAANLGSNVGTHYAWNSRGGQTAPFNYGSFTTVKGFEGSVAQHNNPLLPYLELNEGAAPVQGAVPEPASWMLFIAGFGLVGAAARRRQSGSSVVTN